jgi:hypothetical protein
VERCHRTDERTVMFNILCGTKEKMNEKARCKMGETIAK